jgi:MoaA/NifB/PqqE/SkfB family radical SAM enzyme
MIKKQMENLEYMKKKGYDFKINSVVSSLEQLENNYNFAKEKQYFLRILQNLNDDYETILQHTKFFLQKI